MTEERRKEIALLVVEARMAEDGIPNVVAHRRDTSLAATATGIEVGEMREFFESCFPSALTKILGKKTTISN
ncbi:MAG: hypothetical protein AAB586_00775 [Patescibacteria group bacterium]